jgi:hypothetical protein
LVAGALLGIAAHAAPRRQLAFAHAAVAGCERQCRSLWPPRAYKASKVATYRSVSYFDVVAVPWIGTASPERACLCNDRRGGTADPMKRRENADE